MSQLNRRFEIAFQRSQADWAAADPAACAAAAGCPLTPEGVIVTFFGRPHRVPHPTGDVIVQPTGKVAHPSITIVLLHYLLTADGTPPAARWLNFRQLPDGLFYAQAFAGHGEGLLAQRFGADVAAFRRAAEMAGGAPPAASPGAGLAPPDAEYEFEALPRLAIIVQLWAGDEEFGGRAQVLFEAQAGHYLPTEDLAGVGDWLAHKLSQA